MSVPAAYLAIVVIWSTTPLAVKWSGEGPGFLFGAMGRMGLALVVCVLLMLALRTKLPWNRAARQSYVVGALGAYGTLLCVYWGAQQIPSGIVAVLFGLTPLATSAVARIVLRERSLTAAKLAGMAIGLLGMVVIFGSSIELGARALMGVEAILFGVVLHSLGMVWIKRIDAELAGLAQTTGTLLVTAPLFLITWWVFDGQAPADLPIQALASIVYLSLIASVLGFSLFFYVLRHTDASAMALLTLISPVFALVLGALLNDESLSLRVVAGSALVIVGLALHQWGGLMLSRVLAVGRRRAP